MATVIEQPIVHPPEPADSLPAVEHVLLRGISWSTYEALLNELEGNRRLQLTYDDGDLEIMSPTHKHEWGKTLIGRMIEAYTEELGIPIKSAGSTTFKLELRKKGLEPDECYYRQHETSVRSKDDLDLTVDPPPDLAIEVEVTKRIVKRLPIYAALGFPEIWQLNRGEIKVHTLQPDGTYSVGRTSACLPQLPPEKLEEFLRKRGETDETTWIRGFRAWVRTLPQS
jgi:Uma2 family endonuclease